VPRPRAHPEPRRKRRTREHVIADLSLNHLDRFILLCGNTMEEFRHDYGLDRMMFTYDPRGAVEDGAVYFQLKATDTLKFRSQGQYVAVRVERADLESWSELTYPVILVLYDARADKAYWLYVQAYLRGREARAGRRMSATVTLYIPGENVLSVEAVRRFCEFKAAILAQIPEVTHGEG
jgi:hypothetical protein